MLRQQGCKFNIKQGLTEGPDSHLIPPAFLKLTLLKALHSAAHHGKIQ